MIACTEVSGTRMEYEEQGSSIFTGEMHIACTEVSGMRRKI